MERGIFRPNRWKNLRDIFIKYVEAGNYSQFAAAGNGGKQQSVKAWKVNDRTYLQILDYCGIAQNCGGKMNRMT